MQQVAIESDTRVEKSSRHAAPPAARLVYDGAKPAPGGSRRSRKTIEVFHDPEARKRSRDKPVPDMYPCRTIGAIGDHESKMTDDSTTKNTPVEHGHMSRTTANQSYIVSARTALLPLHISTIQNSRHLDFRPQYSPVDSRTVSRIFRKPAQRDRNPESPRKLLWPTEELYMTKKLKSQQLHLGASTQNIQQARDFWTRHSSHTTIPKSELSACPPWESPSRQSKARLGHEGSTSPMSTHFVTRRNNGDCVHRGPNLPEMTPSCQSMTEKMLEADPTIPPSATAPEVTPQLPQPAYQARQASAITDAFERNRDQTIPHQPETQIISEASKRTGVARATTRYLEARKLPLQQVWAWRILFGALIIGVNITLLVTYFLTHHHQYLLAILVFMKSKDLLSTVVGVLGLACQAVYNRFCPPKEVSQRWILSIVSAYAETDDQIMKTISSLANQALAPHKQVICVIVDGKDPDLLFHFTSTAHAFRQAYVTWKGSSGELVVHTGFIQSTPVIFIRKVRNAGKKDSLILGHDLFNYPRKNMPPLTRQLRQFIYTRIIPELTAGEGFSTFDSIFCTDADSIIHQDALKKLADALARKTSAVAACGILVAELAIPAVEWTVWHLYQQFQYTFGQYIRRQAEGMWGRVTCLPGCITMICVRPEMGPAIAQYARPVTGINLLEHQVQYLGTDRRLTWCILSQSSRLTSILVPGALCETVVPENLEHYLSQRRRWASNAYFNDFYYAFGREQILITRLFALIDIVRQSLVFYRVINTALFIRSLILNFYIIKLTPTLILTKTPAVWFLLLALLREPVLRSRFYKLVVGMCINQVISPVLSVIVFANVLLNMGSQVWGTTGLSSADSRPSSMVHPLLAATSAPTPVTPGPSWSPKRLASIVRIAVRGLGSRSNTARNVVMFDGAEVKNTPETREPDAVPTTPSARPPHDVEPLSTLALRRRTPKASVVTEKEE